MNCDCVQDKLSAYIDRETDKEEQLQIEEHCKHCEACRATVTHFVSIGALLRESEPCVNTAAVWDKVADKLTNNQVSNSPTRSLKATWLYAMLATSASIGLIWLAVRSNTNTQNKYELTHQHPSLAVDFQQVIQSARKEPQAAIATLTTKYEGREVDSNTAEQILGYEPALFRTMPEGFARVSTHVLNMPCCRCSATICNRSDGTSLIVFEHEDLQPIWFGETPAIETQCSGRPCKIVESAGQLAVSWKNNDRQLTLIGADDIAEINQWVASLEF